MINYAQPVHFKGFAEAERKMIEKSQQVAARFFCPPVEQFLSFGKCGNQTKKQIVRSAMSRF
jgi:hypothetical protein